MAKRPTSVNPFSIAAKKVKFIRNGVLFTEDNIIIFEGGISSFEEKQKEDVKSSIVIPIKDIYKFSGENRERKLGVSEFQHFDRERDVESKLIKAMKAIVGKYGKEEQNEEEFLEAAKIIHFNVFTYNGVDFLSHLPMYEIEKGKENEGAKLTGVLYCPSYEKDKIQIYNCSINGYHKNGNIYLKRNIMCTYPSCGQHMYPFILKMAPYLCIKHDKFNYYALSEDIKEEEAEKCINQWGRLITLPKEKENPSNISKRMLDLKNQYYLTHHGLKAEESKEFVTQNGRLLTFEGKENEANENFLARETALALALFTALKKHYPITALKKEFNFIKFNLELLKKELDEYKLNISAKKTDTDIKLPDWIKENDEKTKADHFIYLSMGPQAIYGGKVTEVDKKSATRTKTKKIDFASAENEYRLANKIPYPLKRKSIFHLSSKKEMDITENLVILVFYIAYILNISTNYSTVDTFILNKRINLSSVFDYGPNGKFKSREEVFQCLKSLFFYFTHYELSFENVK